MTTEGKSGNDAKYFATTKKGDVFELKSDLNSTDKQKVKEAVKKVIAQMTLGQDSVSTLFADVIKNLQTDNIELKKLIYLYIINYARSQPDKAILIVNTFQKDAADPSPLIRALAIRTMGCIRVDRITEYLCDPLAKALKDKDPYVRKTAAVCAAKLWDISQELVEEQGFLGVLRDMISDQNPMVVANAVAALAEISEASHKDVFQINSQMLAKLLAALNECTEWGQVFILDCLARYEPNQKDAEDIVERVSPRLKHANSAVAMSAVKVIMKYLNVIKNPKLEEKLIQEKLPPPLITLLSEHKPEIQYVALRNINLIVQKRPDILSQGVKHFFCKYNDPIYVKMEKLEIMIKLAAEKNIEKVLMEFKEYASEVDVEFVRKSVRAIGRCAIKLDKAAERCIKVLLELIQTKINYVVQEAIIVIKDIFRKYPNKYESIIKTLCENLDTLDEPEAKASMVWIIGEYAGRIKNAPELLESFVDSFNDENPQVQLQLLTAVVKLFLQRPEDAKEMVTKVLNMATDNADNPDLRDRGYVYWRLLSTDPEAAQAVVLAQKPVISDDTFQLDPSVLDTLIANISTLASIYHKPPEFFVKGGKPTLVLKAAGKDQKDHKSGGGKAQVEGAGDDGDGNNSEPDDDENDPHDDGRSGPSDEPEEDGGAAGDEKVAAARPEPQKSAPPAAAGAGGGGQQKPAAVADLLGLGNLMGGAAPAAASAAATNTNTAAPSTNSAAAAAGTTTPPPPTAQRIILASDAGKGLQIRNSFARRQNALWMDLTFENTTPNQTLSSFAIKFNVNYAGVTPAAPLKLANPLPPGGSAQFSLPLTESSDAKVFGTTAPYGILQMAIKTELGVAYFQDQLEPHYLFDDNGRVEKQNYIPVWKSISDQKEIKKPVDSRSTALKDVSDIKTRLCGNNIFYVAATNVPQKGTLMYFSFLFKGVSMLLELTLNGAACSVIIKSENPQYSQIALNSIVSLLSN